MRPALAGPSHLGVALLGEALGENEAEEGAPFVGKAGFKLTRLLEWAGFSRNQFDIYNTVWCRPPNNELIGTSYEQGAISHCRNQHWDRLLDRSRVIVPLGNVPTGALIGRKGILSIRGYVWDASGRHVIPTVHPSFIARGQSKYSSAFINDIQKAVDAARNGVPPQVTNYLLDPSPMAALEWAKAYRAALSNDPGLYLAFDIETPGKGEDEDDVDLDEDAPDKTWHIDRIGFSYRGLSALSVPWAPEYLAAIRLLLSSNGPKVVWNAGFDVPRVRRAGVGIDGIIHDGMVAWHILHSDLPKRLGFVATFTTPWQPAWKHLSGARPAYYNATDADVELRSMEKIESELIKANLWDVYQKDVLDLEPILLHMHESGMPVDAAIRLDRACKLDAAISETRGEMESAVPVEARRIAIVYKKQPKDITGTGLAVADRGLLSRPSTRLVSTCAVCGAERPRKDHFKRYVKKINPCSDGQSITVEKPVVEYYRLAAFTPSRDQLVRYHQFLKRPLPLIYDKKTRTRKVSFGERQLKDLSLQYPSDMLYSTILEFRKLDKLAGTYIGRPVEVSD